MVRDSINPSTSRDVAKSSREGTKMAGIKCRSCTDMLYGPDFDGKVLLSRSLSDPGNGQTSRGGGIFS